MKTLVIGSEGFIGSHLMDHFVGMVPMDKKLSGLFQDIYSSESIKRRVKGMDRVIHLAALVSGPDSIRYPKDYWGNNVEGTRNLLKVWDGPLFFASSAAVYDCLNPYALTKRVSENDMKDRPNTSIGRFFNVFGERDEKSVVYHFIVNALKGEDIVIYGDGQQTRSFIYVKDLINEIFFTGGIKDIGYSPAMTIERLAGMILELTNSNSDIVFQDRRDGDPLHSKARNVGRRRWEYGMREGLKRTIRHIEGTLRK